MEMISWWKRKLKSCPKYGHHALLPINTTNRNTNNNNNSNSNERHTNSKRKMDSHLISHPNSLPSSHSIHPPRLILPLTLTLTPTPPTQPPPTRSRQETHTVSKAEISSVHLARPVSLLHLPLEMHEKEAVEKMISPRRLRVQQRRWANQGRVPVPGISEEM